MSNERLRVGDLCVIVRSALNRRIGMECTVEMIDCPGILVPEATIGVSIPGDRSPHPTGFWRLAPDQLRRIPPKSDPVSNYTDQFTPASPDFVEDLKRRLKTQELIR